MDSSWGWGPMNGTPEKLARCEKNTDTFPRQDIPRNQTFLVAQSQQDSDKFKTYFQESMTRNAAALFESCRKPCRSNGLLEFHFGVHRIDNHV